METLIVVLSDASLTSGFLGLLGYIDPGTGSIVIQAIIATVVGLGIAVKLFWHRILKFLGIRKTVKPKESEASPKEER
jgi:hypothetical protein